MRTFRNNFRNVYRNDPAGMAAMMKSRSWLLTDDGEVLFNHPQRGVFEPWLAIRKSSLVVPGQVVGLGVFALRDFPPGSVIGFYSGKVVPDRLLLSYESDKLLEVTRGNRKFVIDGDYGNTGWLQFCNDARGSQLHNNSFITEDGFLVAKKRVRAGQEVLWNYGDSYWDS